MKINNLFNNRDILKRSIIFRELKNKYNGNKILVGNFGFIVILDNIIKKYYIRKEFYEKELANYNLLYGHVNIPKIKVIGNINIFKNILYLIEFENIRKFKGRFNSILDIKTKSISKILGNIHSIQFNSGYTYLHGNLHESNFFLEKKGELGVFDLIGMFTGRIEYDIAIIYINSLYNDNFLNEILKNYHYKKYFQHILMYKYVLQKISEHIKLKIPIKDEGMEGLKKDFIKIKLKLGNLI